MSLSEHLSGYSSQMNLRDVVKRFPIPVVLCGVTFVAGCAISLKLGFVAVTVLFFFIPGFFWAVSTTLAVESLAGKRRKDILWAGSIALFAFFSILSFGTRGMENLQTFIPVTLLLVMVAPFLFVTENSYLDKLGVEIVYWDSGIKGGCRQGGCREDAFLDYLHIDRALGSDALTYSQGGKGGTSRPFSLNCGDTVFNVSGFDMAFPIDLYASSSHRSLDLKSPHISFKPRLTADGQVRLEPSGGGAPPDDTVPVLDLASATMKKAGNVADASCPLDGDKKALPIVLETSKANIRFRFIATHIRGHIEKSKKGEKVLYDSAEGMLLISGKK